MKQDKGARVFAVIAIFLFACYFLGALTAHAQADNPLARYGTATGSWVATRFVSSKSMNLQLFFKGIADVRLAGYRIARPHLSSNAAPPRALTLNRPQSSSADWFGQSAISFASVKVIIATSSPECFSFSSRALFSSSAMPDNLS